ncbi:suppressor of fused domain protein [Undibacterium umbellatum]|uniref:Suppressor of fused domain protein n=1 Tax=Undibacterium umbellatum TaxID=2762300 RepID=A0ABR6ZIT9_9BURK|nr:suppressor of fused domain protein [Undibacterium umbellatum]MBC3911260.1 suppressor of fused domain protein [Undibacterium umbellatum]
MFNWPGQSKSSPSTENQTAKALTTEEQAEQLWQAVYEARAAAYSEQFGPLPADILKMMNLSGVWPGGGLYQLAAPQLSATAWLSSSFGLSNPDMPTTVISEEVSSEHDHLGRPTRTTTRLLSKDNMATYPGRPGYGYEFMVLTQGQEEWPLWLLQWAVNSEIQQDVDFLGRVDQYQGMTVEDIYVGGEQMVNILITRARAPLPATISLPNGEMSLLVATTITDDEMIWSKTNGRNALMNLLQKSGVGQFSHPDRPSVIHPQGVDYASIKSREQAEALAEQGLLRRGYLFPLQFGGEETAFNVAYMPRQGYMRKLFADKQINELVQQGQIQNYQAHPEYLGDSFIPKRIRIQATGDANLNFDIDMY